MAILIALPIVVFLAYTGFCLIRAAYYVYGHPLRKFPGPKPWAASRLFWVYHQFKGKLIFRIKDFHEQYGPVVRTAPDELSFTSPAAWKDIYGGPGVKSLSRDPFIFPPEMPEFPNGIVHANDANHPRIRRQLAYAFSTRALEEQQPLIQGHIDILIKQLRASTKPVDFSSWTNFAAFDIISDLAFGERFKCLEGSEYHPYASTVLVTFITGIFISALNRYGLLGIAEKIIPPSMVKKREEFIAMTKGLVQKRLDSKTTQPDFISYLTPDDAEKLTADEIVSNATVFMIAGSESTGTLLAGTAYYLTRNPDILAKVTQEIRTAFKEESAINSSTVSKLPYMLACLEEGMRMCVPAPFGMARRTSEPTTIAGILVPAGTSVSVPQWAAWHTTPNFTRPDEFLPQRWLGEAEFAGDLKAGFVPFSVGPRNCIGKNLAYLEMRLILARVLWNFDLELADHSFEWTAQKAYIVWDKQPLMMHVKNAR